MECFLNRDVLRVIAQNLEELDLRNMMMTCKTFRDLVGKSDVWKLMNLFNDYDEILEITKPIEIFKTFKKLKICQTNFEVREHYGEFYYLYVLKMWISCRNYWNIFSIVNNLEDLETLSRLSGVLNEPERAMEYKNWNIMFNCLSHALSKINHPEKDRILKAIYVNSNCYENGEVFCEIYLSNRKINYNREDDFLVYPIEPLSPSYTLDDGDFYYWIRVDYKVQSSYRFRILNNVDCANYYNAKEFQSELKRIANAFSFDYKIFINIMFVILSKYNTTCASNLEGVIDESIGFEDVKSIIRRY